MEYLVQPNRDALAVSQVGCVAPDCDDLGPTGHCSCDCQKG